MMALVASRQHRHCQFHWKNYEEKVKKNTTQGVHYYT